MLLLLQQPLGWAENEKAAARDHFESSEYVRLLQTLLVLPLLGTRLDDQEGLFQPYITMNERNDEGFRQMHWLVLAKRLLIDIEI